MRNFAQQATFILIPVHNRRETTLECLKTLKLTGDLDRCTIVVVDDGSTDGTGDAIAQQYPQVLILNGDGNLWWTGAMALAMQAAIEKGAKYLIWLNDDCRITAGTIPDLVHFCHENPNTIVGGQGFEIEQPHRLSFGGKRKTWQGYRFLNVPSGEVIPCDLLSGNLVCVPREIVEKIGYPNPRETPHYGGDSMYLLQAQKAGVQLFLDTRHPAFNHSGEPWLCPTDWVMVPGSPWLILQLAANPYSGLSWRLWWRFNWQAYGLWGVIMFLKKYLSIGPITLLRCLPLSWRQNLFPHRIHSPSSHATSSP